MKNQLKLMISKKVADQSHFGSNIESLFYMVFGEWFDWIATSSSQEDNELIFKGELLFSSVGPVTRIHGH